MRTREWLFSGIGGAVLLAVVGIIGILVARNSNSSSSSGSSPPTATAVARSATATTQPPTPPPSTRPPVSPSSCSSSALTGTGDDIAASDLRPTFVVGDDAIAGYASISGPDGSLPFPDSNAQTGQIVIFHRNAHVTNINGGTIYSCSSESVLGATLRQQEHQMKIGGCGGHGCPLIYEATLRADGTASYVKK